MPAASASAAVISGVPSPSLSTTFSSDESFFERDDRDLADARDLGIVTHLLAVLSNRHVARRIGGDVDLARDGEFLLERTEDLLAQDDLPVELDLDPGDGALLSFTETLTIVSSGSSSASAEASLAVLAGLESSPILALVVFFCRIGVCLLVDLRDGRV